MVTQAIGLVDLCCHLARIADAAATLRPGFTILMYHKILPDDLAREYPFQNLVISETDFRQHAKILSSRFTTKAVSEATEPDQPKNKSRKHTVCVSFDDGYADNFKVAEPILRAEGIPATFYVATGFIDGTPLWFDVAGHAAARNGTKNVWAMLHASRPDLFAKDAPISNPDDLVGALKMVASDDLSFIIGLIRNSFGDPPSDLAFSPMCPGDVGKLSSLGHEIGSHTVNHPILTRMAPGAAAMELSRSAAHIESWTGNTPTSICYPNGDHSAAVRRAAIDSGYRNGVTTRRGSNQIGCDKLALARKFISPTNSCGRSGIRTRAAFHCEVTPIHDVARRLRGQRP